MSPRTTTAATEAPSTRDAILDAAERLFADHGFAGVSVREIAAEAGLKNQASLYHHFKDKRALYEATLARGIMPIVGLIDASSESWLDPARVARSVDRMLDYVAAHPHVPRLIQRAGLDDSRTLRTAITALLKPVFDRGLQVLEGVAGPWEPDDLPHIAIGLYHLIFGYFADAALLEIVVGKDPHSPAALARQRRFLRAAVAQLLGASSVRAVGRKGKGRM
jgi:TetR/AcrR family transcriptional regulator